MWGMSGQGVESGGVMGQRGGTSGEGWPVSGVRAQPVAAREPQLGGSCRQEAGHHQRGTAPYHVLPVLFSQWRVMQLL